MNKTQLSAAVQVNTGRKDKSSLIDQALVFGLDEAAKRHDFRELYYEYSVATASPSVAIDVSYRHLVDVRLIDATNAINSYALRILPKRTLTDRFPDQNLYSAGKPTMVYEEDGDIFFFPKPDVSYTFKVTVIQKPNYDTLDPSDVLSVIGHGLPSITSIDSALIAYATAYVYDALERPETAAIWRGRFESDLLASIRLDKRKPGIKYQMQPMIGVAGSNMSTLNIEPWNDPFARK